MRKVTTTTMLIALFDVGYCRILLMRGQEAVGMGQTGVMG